MSRINIQYYRRALQECEFVRETERDAMSFVFQIKLKSFFQGRKIRL